MAGDVIAVNLAGSQLRVESSPESPLFEIQHRIFFVNVLNFDVGPDFSGYQKESSDNPSELVQQVARYLSDEGFTAQLNMEAQSAYDKVENEGRWLGDSRAKGTEIKLSPPNDVNVPNFKRVLKPYQVPAVAHLLAVENAGNFSVPGSGKTTTVLAAYSVLLQEEAISKLVVIGPRASFVPWEEEFTACFGRPPRSVRITGPKSGRHKLFRAADSAEIVLLTYQMAAADTADLITYLTKHKTMLVLDESHNIKRLEGGKWAEAVLSVAPYATRRVILSGTPVPNSLHDLWSQISFLWPRSQVLGSREQFRYRVETPNATDEIKSELSPLYWRTRKADLGLPVPRFHVLKLKMKPYQRAIYEVIAAKVLAEFIKAPTERTRLRAWRRARLVRLLQAASNPSLLTKYSTEFEVPPIDASGLSVTELIEHYPRYETPPKIEVTLDLVREIVSKGEKLLIWTVFIHNIETLALALREFRPGVVYGAVPKDETEDKEFNREKIISEFKHSSDHNILIANPPACAESVSLHKACHHAVYFDRTFNGAHYMQSLDRIHRVGLERDDKVHYYLLETEDSIDEVIDQRLREKQERMLALLDEDVAVLNLDSDVGEFSEGDEEDQDFAALIQFLTAKANRDRPK
jgi:SNF2 family DNA or RNA helicase